MTSVLGSTVSSIHISICAARTKAESSSGPSSFLTQDPGNGGWRKLWVWYGMHRCPFPIGWLMKIEGFEETPLTTGKWWWMVYQTGPSIFTKRTLLMVWLMNISQYLSFSWQAAFFEDRVPDFWGRRCHMSASFIRAFWGHWRLCLVL